MEYFSISPFHCSKIFLNCDIKRTKITETKCIVYMFNTISSSIEEIYK